MLVSIEWLRSLCPFEQTPEDVARALTARGLTVDALGMHGDDAVLEIDVPANRPDCLGHLGVARELAAAFAVPLREPPAHATDGEGESVERVAGVRIEDQELCPRYSLRVVRGVRLGPSPPWVTRRLAACGLRSINNVVDASNLVLLELGNPIHFFDLARIPDGQIVVRRARSGEGLTTLDGERRRLDTRTLVIADRERPVALAGVMGGADTEIQDTTREVLIEAAYFAPSSVRATARKLGLHTDASHRFERGVDPEAVPTALSLAVRLLQELAGGRPAPGLIDDYPAPPAPTTVVLRPERFRRLVGYEPGADEIDGALRALSLETTAADDGALRVAVPSWRVDLTREADLVEEVARHLGYERIPAVADAARASALASTASRATLDAEERARDVLAHLGFCEAFSYAMIGDGEDARFVEPEVAPALPLGNPIAEQHSHLRRSILPGLLQAADLNLRRGVEDVRLYELGRVFQSRGAGAFPAEPLRLGIAWCGAAEPRHWSADDRRVGLFDVAGVVEQVIRSLRPLAPELPRSPGGLPGHHPGVSLTWRAPSEEALGWCGLLHPELREARDLAVELYLAELDLGRLERLPHGAPSHRPLARVPAVTRDLSLLLRRETPFTDVREVLQSVVSPAPATLDVVDRYEGAPLDPGELSLTVRVTLQPHERTLTDDETEDYRSRLVSALAERLGVRLRGGS